MYEWEKCQNILTQQIYDNWNIILSSFIAFVDTPAQYFFPIQQVSLSYFQLL